MLKFLAATLKEDSSSEDTLPVKVVQVVDPLSTDTVFEGSNYVDDYVEIENIVGELQGKSLVETVLKSGQLPSSFVDDERGIHEDEEVIENLPPVIKELMGEAIYQLMIISLDTFGN